MSAPPVRLRQVVLITSDLPTVAARLQDELGLPEPFIDPGVSEFGLENRVFAAGESFIEVLTPIAEGTAGGRHLERHGGDAGYMAIFQLADRAAARSRPAELGMRIVWQTDLEDISGTHLHPADVGAAIVSLDWADPPESWHWAGQAWRGGAPAERVGGVTSLTVAATDPGSIAARWAAVLGAGAAIDGTVVRLAEAGQDISFVPAETGQREGIVGCGLALGDAKVSALDVGGVRFAITATS